jgi:hypothetical protein
MDSAGHILLLLLIALGPAWVLVASALFDRLRTQHWQTFEVLGRPQVSRYGISGVALVFILRRNHRHMADKKLSLLSDLSLLVLVAAPVIGVAAARCLLR